MLSNGTILEVIEGVNPAVAIGNVDSIGEMGFGEAEEIEVTSLNEPTGYKKFIQGLKDSGTTSIGGFKEPTDAGQTKVRELFAAGTVVNWRVTYSDGSVALFSGFVKKFNFAEAAPNNALKWAVDIRISGGVTYTEATGEIGTLAITMAAAGSGLGLVSLTGESGGLLVYKTAAAVTAPAYKDDLSGWTGLPISRVVAATSGHKICVALVNAAGECLAVSNVLNVTVGA